MKSERHAELIYRWCVRHVVPVKLSMVRNPMVWQAHEDDMYNGYRKWLYRNKIFKICSIFEFNEHLAKLYPDKEKTGPIYYGLRHYMQGVDQDDELFITKSIILWDSNSQMMIAAS